MQLRPVVAGGGAWSTLTICSVQANSEQQINKTLQPPKHACIQRQLSDLLAGALFPVISSMTHCCMSLRSLANGIQLKRDLPPGHKPGSATILHLCSGYFMHLYRVILGGPIDGCGMAPIDGVAGGAFRGMLFWVATP